LYCIWQTGQVEEDEMDGACSTNGRQEERVWIIGGKTRGKETARKTKTFVGGNMEWGGRDRIGLAQDRNKRTAITKLWVA
jgi:hypothetical protein